MHDKKRTTPLARFLESMRAHAAAAAVLAASLILAALNPPWIQRYEAHKAALEALTMVVCPLIVLYLFSIRRHLTTVVLAAPLALVLTCLVSFTTYNWILERSCKIRGARDVALPYEATSDVAAAFLRQERTLGFRSAAEAADKFSAQWIEPQPTQTEILHMPGPIPGELGLVITYALVFASAESALALIVLSGFMRSRRPRRQNDALTAV